MIRRYDMRRSDNFPACSTIERQCLKESGKFFVFTGFPVKSVLLVPIKVPQGGELIIDTDFFEKDGFSVSFRGLTNNSIVKFSYQAQ